MNAPEHWLGGPVPEVPALLQPLAHALLQAKDEIHKALGDFNESKLWEKPNGVASAGFHLQHIVGVLDRLSTYASGGAVSDAQLKYLSEEGLQLDHITLQGLLDKVDEAIDKFIVYLKTVDITVLTEPRFVGRKKYPSTVIGLLFHAAEHTMRHTGQLLVTVKVLRGV